MAHITHTHTHVFIYIYTYAYTCSNIYECFVYNDVQQPTNVGVPTLCIDDRDVEELVEDSDEFRIL